ncbi:hypothetical protein D3C76_1529350 [compost metagenome]
MGAGSQLCSVSGQLSTGCGLFGQFQGVVHVVALHHQATVAGTRDHPKVVVTIRGRELDQSVGGAGERVSQDRAVRSPEQRH